VLVRPARLTDGSEGGKVRVEFDRHPTNGTRISRLDVAAFMVEQLSSDRYLHKAPTIAY
jgi:hypothetical protein